MSDRPIPIGSAPAFPQGLTVGEAAAGMSKREYIATLCLQGLLASKGVHKYTTNAVARSALIYADQLLNCIEHGVEAEPAPYVQPGSFDLVTPEFGVQAG